MPGDSKAAAPRQRLWAPRMWEGFKFSGWLRLLVRNRFSVDWRYSYIALSITFVSLGHSLLAGLQQLLYGRRIRATTLKDDPIFIVGHWRTGTTLLHELLCLDPRFTSPNSYQCMVPHHFLLSEGVMTRWFNFLMPSRRPMDNMAAGWKKPQEDEFALCMMGLPSPYLTVAFPNNPPLYDDYLDLRNVPAAGLARWKDKLLSFLKVLTFKDPRRIVLKSPTHSARIPTLLEMFPAARFVHIVRDPMVVYPSTVNLWKSLYRTHGLQPPTFAGVEERVFATAERLYTRLEAGKALIPAGHFHELHYEDLVQDPVGVVRQLYEALGLGGFDGILPHLQAYLDATRGYETNKYTLTPEQESEVARRWGPVFGKYGYLTEVVAR